MADAIIDGHPLRIEGGDFRICDGKSSKCGLGGCYKQEFYQKYATEKGEGIMRVAVTYENGQIFQHFGHTAEFKVYDVQDGKVIHSEVVDTNGSGHGALAGVLNALKADVLICGGIGGGAQMALSAAGIKLYGGVSGDADAAVEAFVNGTLDYNPDVKCSHHDHEHGEDIPVVSMDVEKSQLPLIVNMNKSLEKGTQTIYRFFCPRFKENNSSRAAARDLARDSGA